MTTVADGHEWGEGAATGARVAPGVAHAGAHLVGLDAGGPGDVCYLDRDTLLPAGPFEQALTPASEYTTRQGPELIGFVLSHLDDEERGWFMRDVGEAALAAWQDRSFTPLDEVMRDWERTVEVKLDPELSRALDEAFAEADRVRGSGGP